tara:strand:- start:111 stop:293 length:183 start_codon:yes stop_codon:yes gene_type:complete
MKKIINMINNNIKFITYHKIEEKKVNSIVKYIKDNKLPYIIDTYKYTKKNYSIFLEKLTK